MSETCVCRPGNPCLFHHGQVRDGWRTPDEVPHPENYKLVRPHFLYWREKLARRLAPWAFEGPKYEVKPPHPAAVNPPADLDREGEA